MCPPLYFSAAQCGKVFKCVNCLSMSTHHQHYATFFSMMQSLVVFKWYTQLFLSPDSSSSPVGRVGCGFRQLSEGCKWISIRGLITKSYFTVREHRGAWLLSLLSEVSSEHCQLNKEHVLDIDVLSAFCSFWYDANSHTQHVVGMHYFILCLSYGGCFLFFNEEAGFMCVLYMYKKKMLCNPLHMG